MSDVIAKLQQALRVMKGETGVVTPAEETQKVSLDKFQELVMGEFGRAKKDAEDGRTQDAARRMDRVQHYVGDALKALDGAKDEAAVELTVFKSETLPAVAMDAGMGASILERLGSIEEALKAGHLKPKDEEDDKKKDKDKESDTDKQKKPEDEEEDDDKKKDKSEGSDTDKQKKPEDEEEDDKKKDKDKAEGDAAGKPWPRDLNAAPVAEDKDATPPARSPVVPTLPENVIKRAENWGNDSEGARV